MEFRLLGPIEAIDDDGRRLELGGSRPRALLALLLLHANEVVSSDRLIDELWGAEPSAGVANTLQQTVSRLRRALGQGRIETRSPGYLLRVEAGELDMARCEALLAAGDGSSLREALGLWQGEPLADFAFEPFAQGAIARIGELRLAAWERRIEADLADGRTVGLVGEIEALVAQRPLRERLRGLQMLALYREGRQAEALAAYQDTRRLLGDELGLDPGEELQRLEKQILTHDPALDPPLAEGRPGPTQPVEATAPPAPAAESRRVVTVLFCDMTAGEVAEDGDPEALRGAQARALALATAAVSRHGGVVDAASGSQLTAVFGVPLVHEDDALRALRAAVEIREAAPGLDLVARFGVHSGEVIAGGEQVAGVPVAVARRLGEAAAAGEVLLGPSTLVLAARAADVEPAEPLRLRGGAAPLAAFRLVRVRERAEPEQRQRFVGRESEVALVRDAWERVQQGRSCELLTVVGDAGIGKSRLVAEALAPLDAPILRGRCLPYGEGITYWPVVDVLRQLDSEPPAEAAGTIRTLLGASQVATTAGEIAWAFRRTLDHAAAEQPLIVVVDDIHWAEDALLDLLEQTALLSSGAAILLLCIARPELVERRPGWPGQHRLQPLPATSVEQLLPATLDNPLREKITRAAHGNPLFIQEMLAVAGSAGDDLVVPLTLQAVLAARLDQLDPDERLLLTLGAVEGETFHRGTTQALASDSPAVGTHLAALVRKGLIRPDRADLPGEDGYRFRHILIRDAAYATLPRARRRDLHAAFADWLHTSHAGWAADHPDILTHHYGQAHALAHELGDTDTATRLAQPTLHYLLLAGERMLHLDPANALALADRALELLAPDDPALARALLIRGEALGSVGSFEEAVEVLERAAALALAHEQSELAADALGPLGFLARRIGRDDWFGFLEQAVALLEATPGPRLVAALGELVDGNMLRAEFRLGIENADRALALAWQLGLPAPGWALGGRGTCRTNEGDLDGIADMEHAIELLSNGGNIRHAIAVQHNLAIAFGAHFGPARAIEQYDRCIAFGEERGSPALLSAANRLGMFVAAGRLAEAARDSEPVIASLRQAGDRIFAGLALQNRVRALGERGRDAREATEELLENLFEGGTSLVRQQSEPAVVVAAFGALCGGDPETAVALLEQHTLQPHFRAGRTAILAARVATRAGRPDLIAAPDDLLRGPARTESRIAFGVVNATALEAAGDREQAAALYAAAAAAWAEHGFLLEHAYAQLGQGRCLTALGRHAEAAGVLEEARAIFARIEATPALAETEALLQQAAAAGS